MENERVEMAILPDSQLKGLIRFLPARARPFALLARFDRPIGWWLLFWPCVWGLGLAGGIEEYGLLIPWFLAGAIAMRGAGCVYNDILDRDLDRLVARTRARPAASGAVSLKAAWIWLIILCLFGLLVLLQLPRPAQVIALASLLPVAVYPAMKRITWWPQLWLGLVFSWGILVGWVAVTGTLNAVVLLLYAGTLCWVVGYDTIYALQDREDDALIGVRSSALRLGRHVRLGTAIFYVAALSFWATALWLVRPQNLAIVPLLPMALHLAWQIITLDPDAGDDALAKFRSNHFAGLLMALACIVVGASA
jgi:4-hydroxybenzoate polyprenyltransferase